MTKLKPGNKAPSSGQYAPVGPRGKQYPNEVTVVKNEPLPPTQKPGMTYKLVDPTKHKSSK